MRLSAFRLAWAQRRGAGLSGTSRRGCASPEDNTLASHFIFSSLLLESIYLFRFASGLQSRLPGVLEGISCSFIAYFTAAITIRPSLRRNGLPGVLERFALCFNFPIPSIRLQEAACSTFFPCSQRGRGCYAEALSAYTVFPNVFVSVKLAN